jgi:hypothetical protein
MFERLKKWVTLDRCVDLAVDVLLIIWDVLTSPILILVRLLRWFIGGWLQTKIKKLARWIAHWFERKRAYRKQHGYGIFKTYWFLIIPSPLILFALFILAAVITGTMELTTWFLDELELFFKGDEL